MVRHTSQGPQSTRRKKWNGCGRDVGFEETKRCDGRRKGKIFYKKNTTEKEKRLQWFELVEVVKRENQAARVKERKEKTKKKRLEPQENGGMVFPRPDGGVVASDNIQNRDRWKRFIVRKKW